MVFVMVAVIFLAASSKSNFYKEHAHRLIKDRITSPDRQQKALETLLALQSDYPSPSEAPQSQSGFGSSSFMVPLPV
jgi:hypothetical protein